MSQTKKIYWADKLGAMSAFLYASFIAMQYQHYLAMGIGFLGNPISCLSLYYSSVYFYIQSHQWKIDKGN